MQAVHAHQAGHLIGQLRVGLAADLAGIQRLHVQRLGRDGHLQRRGHGVVVVLVALHPVPHAIGAGVDSGGHLAAPIGLVFGHGLAHVVLQGTAHHGAGLHQRLRRAVVDQRAAQGRFGVGGLVVDGRLDALRFAVGVVRVGVHDVPHEVLSGIHARGRVHAPDAAGVVVVKHRRDIAVVGQRVPHDAAVGLSGVHQRLTLPVVDQRPGPGRGDGLRRGRIDGQRHHAAALFVHLGIHGGEHHLVGGHVAVGHIGLDGGILPGEGALHRVLGIGLERLAAAEDAGAQILAIGDGRGHGRCGDGHGRLVVGVNDHPVGDEALGLVDGAHVIFAGLGERNGAILFQLDAFQLLRLPGVWHFIGLKIAPVVDDGNHQAALFVQRLGFPVHIAVVAAADVHGVQVALHRDLQRGPGGQVPVRNFLFPRLFAIEHLGEVVRGTKVGIGLLVDGVPQIAGARLHGRILAGCVVELNGRVCGNVLAVLVRHHPAAPGRVEAVVFRAFLIIALHRQKIGEGALAQRHIGVHVIQLAVGEFAVHDEGRVRRRRELHRIQRQRGHGIHIFGGFVLCGLRKARGQNGHRRTAHDGVHRGLRFAACHDLVEKNITRLFFQLRQNIRIERQFTEYQTLPLIIK